MRSVLTKLFGVYLVTTAVLMFVVLYFSFDKINDDTINNISEQLDNLNRASLSQTKKLLIKKEYAKLDSLVKFLGQTTNTRLTLILPDGHVVADSDEEPIEMENHADRPEIFDAGRFGKGKAVRFSYTINQDLLYKALKITDKGEDIGYSRISIPISYLDDLYSGIIWKIITITAVVFFLSIVLLYFFSRKISGNINKLVEASNRISEGDFESKVYLNTNDELSILGQNFNNMSDNLKQNFEEINKKQEEITSIIKSIKDGIVVIDSNEKIVLCNKNFRNYFEISEVSDKYYWEVVRDLEFQKLVKKIQSSNKSKVSELHFKDNYYLVSGSWNELKEEVVVILYDINELKRLEQIKRDFIVNVSHELKTPLTAIKGFIDTMVDDVNEEHRHYLNIIERQTKRLIFIVEDLLKLSVVENKDTKIDLKHVNLNKMVDDLLTIFSVKAGEKNIELKSSISPDIIINVDEFMFEQVLVNLIQNGIEHTDEGSIKISAEVVDDKTIIKVADTGNGISPEHITRIFERFYTVDKSRAKSLSGTGLGLSIVKHIINLHEAEIRVESKVGEGTTFIIEI